MSRVEDAMIQFRFFSNETDGAEGLYIDDVRIVALANWDSVASPSDDEYSNRQYELRNLGQVAGNGTTENDLQATNAWEMICLLYTSPSPRDRQKSRMPSSA